MTGFFYSHRAFGSGYENEPATCQISVTVTQIFDFNPHSELNLCPSFQSKDLLHFTLLSAGVTLLCYAGATVAFATLKSTLAFRKWSPSNSASKQLLLCIRLIYGILFPTADYCTVLQELQMVRGCL